MPSPKRERRERTHEWEAIQQRTLWPEQQLYEAIRPLLLFGETAGEREKEIDVPRRTLARKADEFETHGIAASLLLRNKEEPEKPQTPSPKRSANSLLTSTLNYPR